MNYTVHFLKIVNWYQWWSFLFQHGPTRRQKFMMEDLTLGPFVYVKPGAGILQALFRLPNGTVRCVGLSQFKQWRNWGGSDTAGVDTMDYLLLKLVLLITVPSKGGTLMLTFQFLTRLLERLWDNEMLDFACLNNRTIRQDTHAPQIQLVSKLKCSTGIMERMKLSPWEILALTITQLLLDREARFLSTYTMPRATTRPKLYTISSFSLSNSSLSYFHGFRLGKGRLWLHDALALREQDGNAADRKEKSVDHK